MARTPEQIVADDNLTAAIEQVHQAYAEPDEPVQGVLTKYVVLAQRQYWDDNGDSCTMSYSSPREDVVPLSNLLGMVEYASTMYRKAIASDEDY